MDSRAGRRYALGALGAAALALGAGARAGEPPTESGVDAAAVAAVDAAPTPAATEGAEAPGVPELPSPLSPPPGAKVSLIPRGAERWTIPDAVLSAVRAVRDRPLADRIEAASRPFLGLPYLDDAAGEFDALDADPPSRYDAFDCLTFVEEVLSLALAGDPLHAPSLRDAFRYRGAERYAARRHLMEAQWLPDAVANGLLQDITARIGPARTLRKSVSADQWSRWRRWSLLRERGVELPVGEWRLDYLDLDAAEASVARIPPGALILTLRQERPYTPIVITHVGLSVAPPAGGSPELRIRHATRMGKLLVRDDRLAWYVTHLRDYTNWPALGIAVYVPREQGPRQGAMPMAPGDAAPTGAG